MSTEARGRLLEQWRLASGLTVDEVAVRAGTHPRTVLRLERGRWFDVRIGVLERVLSAVGGELDVTRPPFWIREASP